MDTPFPETAPGDHALSIQRIVAAVDLPSRAEATARYAVGIAKAFGASIVLVHVHAVVEVNEFMVEEDYRELDRQRQAAQEALTKLTEILRRAYPPCEARFLIGDPAGQIALLARELNADLIITASHHPGLLTRLFNLDQAPHILHRAPCPVLVYHPKEDG
ncbi:MAG: universal stress protein [Verrucomicrobia bacterium]|nr:universal stress protein [Verrucomicrobiota bacterium]